jgi:hypothetical protein
MSLSGQAPEPPPTPSPAPSEGLSAGAAGRPSRRKIVSRHFLRRRARSAERHLQQGHPSAPEGRYVVEPAARGPYRWYVVERR